MKYRIQSFALDILPVLDNFERALAIKSDDEAIKNLSLYLNTVNKLQDYMAGNVISGFIKDTTNLINKVEKKHKNMNDVEKFLDEVVNTMNEQ